MCCECDLKSGGGCGVCGVRGRLLPEALLPDGWLTIDGTDEAEATTVVAAAAVAADAEAGGGARRAVASTVSSPVVLVVHTDMAKRPGRLPTAAGGERMTWTLRTRP